MIFNNYFENKVASVEKIHASLVKTENVYA